MPFKVNQKHQLLLCSISDLKRDFGDDGPMRKEMHKFDFKNRNFLNFNNSIVAKHIYARK